MPQTTFIDATNHYNVEAPATGAQNGNSFVLTGDNITADIFGLNNNLALMYGDNETLIDRAYRSRPGSLHRFDVQRLEEFEAKIGNHHLSRAPEAWSAWLRNRGRGLAPSRCTLALHIAGRPDLWRRGIRRHRAMDRVAASLPSASAVGAAAPWW